MPIIENSKNELALPEIGFIRKGAEKQAGKVGKDLNQKFRVGFFIGNEGKQELFIKHYGSLYPERIHATLAFPTVDENWDCWFEAYSRSRMIARADGVQFHRLIDMKTGAVVVNNKKPYKAFDPNEPVGSYFSKAKNEEISLYAQKVGRLRFIIRELQLLNLVTLHTTSVYDISNITQQLNAINQIAQMAGRTIAGVPLEIFRSPKDITWVKPDGSSARVTKWLINIEASQRWVDSMLANMQALAVTPALPESPKALPEITITSSDREAVNDFSNDDEEDEIIESTGRVIEESEDEPERENIKDENQRPYEPEYLIGNLKSVILDIEEGLKEKRYKVPADLPLKAEMIYPSIGNALAGYEPGEVPGYAKNIMLVLSGANDHKAMTNAQKMAMLKWLEPVADSGGLITPCDNAIIETRDLLEYILEKQGDNEEYTPMDQA